MIAGGRDLEGVTVIVQNSDPFTFFRKRPIRVAENAALDNGSLSLAVLRKATPLELPTLIPRLLSGRAGDGRPPPPGGEPARARHRAGGGTRRRAFPVQVDGDYIGLHEEAEYRAVPRGLMAVSCGSRCGAPAAAATEPPLSPAAAAPRCRGRGRAARRA